MRKFILVVVILILFLIVFWGGTIIKCEITTVRHGDEFLSFEEVNTASKFKILTYKNDFARIYCINFDKSNGSVHNFIKRDGIWIYNAWEDGGWSKSGSADGFIWPYIR